MKQIEDTLLHGKLKEYFGFSSFKGNQEAVIRNVLAGKDTFVLMPTGGGKSLCYQLPALLMDGVAIIISPLIALMKNQVDAMRTFSSESGIAHFLNSSLNKTAVAKVRADVLEGRTKLLYFAPESLTKEDNVAFLRKIKISFYAIDEAHCISEWGHDFRPEYRRIRPIINEIGTAPLIALTATATPKVQLDIQKNLGMNDASVFKSSFNRPNLYYEIRPKNDVDRDIIRFIKQKEGRSGIIYCLSRKKVEELAELLVANGVKALPYHAGMDAATRAKNQDDFLMERADVIVASCGGYPKDMSLYQGTKTIDNVESGLKPGGTLILLIEAREGGGPSEYFDWIENLRDGTMEKRLREHFTIPGYVFLLNCEQAHRYNILMLSSVAQETVAPMGLKSFSSLESLLAAADLEGKSVYVIPNGSTVVPHVKGE